MARARAAFYGDDFTGSVDALLQFTRHGWSGRLFADVPSPALLTEAARECDVVGIAGVARSLPTTQIETEVRPALAALAALSPQIVQYKACSTADSSPTIGSIGRIIEIAQDVFTDRTVPMLFAQPDFGRYTVFGHHFARELDQVYRLDRQPTMSSHPSTPMTESDLVEHLSAQTSLPLSHLSCTEYGSPVEIAARVTASPAAGMVMDALSDADTARVGAAVWALADTAHPQFVIGSGGLSHGLAAAHPGSHGQVPRSVPDDGPVLAVSGSRSAQTRRQIDAAEAAGWHVEELPEDDLACAAAAERTIAALRAGTSVAFRSDELSAEADEGALLALIARNSARVIHEAVHAAAVSRIIVCGGDTSSRITRALGIHSLSIAANPTGNVVVLTAHCPGSALDGVHLLLKGGQVGDVDLFESIRRPGSTDS